MCVTSCQQRRKRLVLKRKYRKVKTKDISGGLYRLVWRISHSISCFKWRNMQRIYHNKIGVNDLGNNAINSKIYGELRETI